MQAAIAVSRRAVAWLLLVCVAALSLYLYSSLHQHNPLSGRPCAFSQVEKSPALGSAAQIELPLPSECIDPLPQEGRYRVAEGTSPRAISRAPPLNS